MIHATIVVATQSCWKVQLPANGCQFLIVPHNKQVPLCKIELYV